MFGPDSDRSNRLPWILSVQREKLAFWMLLSSEMPRNQSLHSTYLFPSRSYVAIDLPARTRFWRPSLVFPSHKRQHVHPTCDRSHYRSGSQCRGFCGHCPNSYGIRHLNRGWDTIARQGRRRKSIQIVKTILITYRRANSIAELTTEHLPYMNEHPLVMSTSSALSSFLQTAASPV
jgi:hypothetical protein